MPDVRLFKVAVMVDDRLGTCPAVEYEGAVWLVPKWLPLPNEQGAKPERMIRLDQFRYQRFDPPATGPGPVAGIDFAINDPLPKALFDGELSSQLTARYIVLDKPDVTFQFPSLH